MEVVRVAAVGRAPDWAAERRSPPVDEWLVAYDISADRRRLAVAKLLGSYGDRVQYSVFAVDLSRADAVRLAERIAAMTEPGDRLLLLPTCPACQRLDSQGRGTHPAGAMRPTGFVV